MIISKKIRIFPTEKQILSLWKSAGTSRWAYNWALDKQIEHFKKTGKLNKISDNDLRKELTQLKKQTEFSWLFEISNNIPKQTIKDLCKAIDRFHKESKKNGYKYKKRSIKLKKNKLDFTDFVDFPRFKSRKKSKPSFYNDNVKLKFKENSVLIEKVGWIKIKEQISAVKYSNPRITFDGKYWFLSVGIEQDVLSVELTNESIGIDVGIKDLAICSNGMTFKNINKTKAVKKLKKKLKRKQRQVSRKYQKNKIEGKEKPKFIKTNNIEKLEKELKLIHRRLKNKRLNHLHQATSKIVKTKPFRIVIEDLNIKGMMKNRHLSKAIQEQKLYEFSRQIEYKCKFYGIEFIKADRFYPSSKTCSNCGNIKKDLKLKDRVYKCDKCGFVIDRDVNASLNLSHYKLVV